MDGLRGVAALAVLGHHTEHMAHLIGPFSHAYLFVDLFFAISGFVIAHTYEPRFRHGLGFPAFMKARLIRIYPLIALGVMLGLFVILIGRFPKPHPFAALPFQLLLLPSPAHGMDFPLNTVEWSLMFEMFANVAHFALLARLRMRGLAAVTALAFGCLLVVGIRYHSLNGGFIGANMPVGLARVCFSYSAGVLAYRLHAQGWRPALRLPWWGWALATVLLVFAASTLIGRFAFWPELAVLIAFPLIVLAAATPLSGGGRNGVAALLGDLSYPLYAVHYPLLALVAFTATRLTGSEGGTAWAIVWTFGLEAICVAAWALLKWYDEPLRARLRGAKPAATAPAL